MRRCSTGSQRMTRTVHGTRWRPTWTASPRGGARTAATSARRKPDRRDPDPATRPRRRARAEYRRRAPVLLRPPGPLDPLERGARRPTRPPHVPRRRKRLRSAGGAARLHLSARLLARRAWRGAPPHLLRRRRRTGRRGRAERSRLRSRARLRPRTAVELRHCERQRRPPRVHRVPARRGRRPHRRLARPDGRLSYRRNGRPIGSERSSSTPKPGWSSTDTGMRPRSGTGSPVRSGVNMGTTEAASGAIIKNSAKGLSCRVPTKWYEYTLDPCGIKSTPWAAA